MSIKDLTITDQTVQGIYVQSQPDRLTGTAQQNKAVFDAYPALIKQRFNQLLELLTAEGGAGEIPVGPIEGVTAQNVQQALAAIQQNLTAYINKIKSETGAAEVGVSTISGMYVGNVQQALEGLRAIQITLDSNIQKLMSVNGAAAVGVSTISGMQAQNVQKALEELRKAIDDSVSGIIPGGSITTDMLADDVKIILKNKLNSPMSLSVNADLNDVKTPGLYYCDGATGANRPINTGAFSLLVENTGSWGGNGRKQTFTAHDSGTTYKRVNTGENGKTWTGWEIIITTTRLSTNVDLNDVKTPGLYYCDGATGANRPINTGAFSLLVENTGSYGGNGRKQTFTDYSSGVTYARTISGDSGEAWQGWKPLATATPPQVRNFTLQSGFTADGDCTFFVTQESAVFLSGGVSGTLSANQDTQIGTLPADVSPDAQRRRPAVTNAGAAYIDIHTDGTVWAHPFAAASQCWFDCSFVAGGGS